MIHLKLTGDSETALQQALRALPGVKNLESAGDGIRIFVDSLDGILPKIVEITGARLHDVCDQRSQPGKCFHPTNRERPP